MSAIFSRPELAAKMADQLLNPGVLDEALRSGLFLSGLRRTGKTTFLRHDLIPALERQGALIIYVDLWSDVKLDPAELVHSAIRDILTELASPGSRLLERLSRIGGVGLGAAGLSFSFDVRTLGAPGGVTLADALTAVVDQAQTDLVLIIDEVQQAMSSPAGEKMLLALKAARDAVNTRVDTPGHLIFIGTGSHRAHVVEMSTRSNQAFAGAASIDYPVLGREYVVHLLERLSDDVAAGSSAVLPSVSAALEAFENLGHRPEELIRALRLLSAEDPDDLDPDVKLNVVAHTLRAAAADIELNRVDSLGELARLIFAQIASADGEVKGLYTKASREHLTQSLGREVSTEEIQSILGDLKNANLIMRSGHGRFGITDPFVQQAWRDRAKLLSVQGSAV